MESARRDLVHHHVLAEISLGMTVPADKPPAAKVNPLDVQQQEAVDISGGGRRAAGQSGVSSSSRINREYSDRVRVAVPNEDAGDELLGVKVRQRFPQPAC